MDRIKKIIRGLVLGFGFFILYYVISMTVSFVTELVVILRYFPSYFDGGSSLTKEQYALLLNKLYSLNGLISVITTVLVISVVALIFMFRGMDSKRILGMKKPKERFGWLSYFGGIFTGVSFSALIALLPIPDSWNQANNESVGIAMSGNRFLVFVSVFITAPLLEEFVFRGCMMGFIKRDWNTIAAVLIPAIVFGWIHGNILQGLYTFSAALIFSYFRIKGDSFWCAFLAHCGFNMSNILLVFLGNVPILLVLGIGLFGLIEILYGAEFIFGRKTKKINADKDIIK